MEERDIPKTPFQTRSGLYKYTIMSFGLTNVPAAFQRAMNGIFGNERGKFLEVYLDDIIVFSKSKEEHMEHLKIVFEKLKESGLRLKKEKCQLFQEELIILGYKIKANKVKPLDERLKKE